MSEQTGVLASMATLLGRVVDLLDNARFSKSRYGSPGSSPARSWSRRRVVFRQKMSRLDAGYTNLADLDRTQRLDLLRTVTSLVSESTYDGADPGLSRNFGFTRKMLLDDINECLVSGDY